MRWSDMEGDSRRRFCDHCQLHVQNLSAMSQREVSRVLARREQEHVCVTYTRRSDGTLVTRWDGMVDALFGPFRRGFAWLLAASMPIVLSACQTQSQLTGRVLPKCNTPQPKKVAAVQEERVIVTGGI
jgi:hypothetical protein